MFIAHFITAIIYCQVLYTILIKYFICFFSVDTQYFIDYNHDTVNSDHIIMTPESSSQGDGKEAARLDDGLRILARILAHHFLTKRSPCNRKSDIESNEHQVSGDKSDESVS